LTLQAVLHLHELSYVFAFDHDVVERFDADCRSIRRSQQHYQGHLELMDVAKDRIMGAECRARVYRAALS
jgi:hypothetical protein